MILANTSSYKKAVLIMAFAVILSFFGCSQSGFQKLYIEPPAIQPPPLSDDCTTFDTFYNEVADDYYQVANYEGLDMYRYDDVAVVVFDFNDAATHQDFNKAAQFFNNLFIVRHGNTLVSVGALGGFFKKLYDDDYEFWKYAYFVCKVNGETAFSARYELNDEGSANKVSTSQEQFETAHQDIFKLESEKLSRFSNLAALENIGQCSYRRNVFGNKLYIDIYLEDNLSEAQYAEKKQAVEDAFTDVDDESLYYYQLSYTTVIVRFVDKTAPYYYRAFDFNPKHQAPAASAIKYQFPVVEGDLTKVLADIDLDWQLHKSENVDAESIRHQFKNGDDAFIANLVVGRKNHGDMLDLSLFGGEHEAVPHLTVENAEPAFKLAFTLMGAAQHYESAYDAFSTFVNQHTESDVKYLRQRIGDYHLTAVFVLNGNTDNQACLKKLILMDGDSSAGLLADNAKRWPEILKHFQIADIATIDGAALTTIGEQSDSAVVGAIVEGEIGQLKLATKEQLSTLLPVDELKKYGMSIEERYLMGTLSADGNSVPILLRSTSLNEGELALPRKHYMYYFKGSDCWVVNFSVR